MIIDITVLVTFLTIVSIVLAIVVSVIRIFYYKERMEALDEDGDTEEVVTKGAPTYSNYKCPLCNGDGIYKGKKCGACEGVGMFRAPQDSVVCGTCGGAGLYQDKRQSKKKCRICRGRGRVPSFPIKGEYEEYEDDD
ncbi:MAG: hypothetical protein ACFFBS_10265 [Promethearchaeota archaeon]